MSEACADVAAGFTVAVAAGREGCCADGVRVGDSDVSTVDSRRRGLAHALSSVIEAQAVRAAAMRRDLPIFVMIAPPA
jgi:hypothetical protein